MHLADHLFLNNHAVPAQGYPAHLGGNQIINAEGRTIHIAEGQGIVAQGEPDLANEDDSLLFEFDARKNLPPSRSEMHHHQGADHQPGFRTVDVNLEELHREE